MRLFIINSTGWDSLTSTAIKLLDVFPSSVDFSFFFDWHLKKIPLNFQILKIIYLQCDKFSVWWEVYFLLKGFEWVCIFCDNRVKFKHCMSAKSWSGCFFVCLFWGRLEMNVLYLWLLNFMMHSTSCQTQNTVFSSGTNWDVTILSWSHSN